MRNLLIITSITFICFFANGCTKAEIESNANEAGKVVGKTLKGISSGFIEGLKGETD